MNDLTHIIISRVNIRWRDYASDPEWNEVRVRLLNSCLRPSLAQQTRQDFTLVTLWGQDFEGGELPNEIKATTRNGRNLAALSPTKYTLVTRVDSDDCLRRDFVENLRRLVDTKQELPRFYDVGQYYVYQHDTGAVINRDVGRFYQRRNKTTAFVSVLADDKVERTHTGGGHGAVGTRCAGGAWHEELAVLVNVHGFNDSSTMERMKKGVPAKINLADYSPVLAKQGGEHGSG